MQKKRKETVIFILLLIIIFSFCIGASEPVMSIILLIVGAIIALLN